MLTSWLEGTAFTFGSMLEIFPLFPTFYCYLWGGFFPFQPHKHDFLSFLACTFLGCKPKRFEPLLSESPCYSAQIVHTNRHTFPNNNVNEKITRVWLAEQSVHFSFNTRANFQIARALPKFHPSWISVMRFSCKLLTSNNMIFRAVCCK